MLKRIGRICPRALLRSTKGVALVEVVIAVVVLGLITASVAPVLVLITKSQFSWSEQRIAESLTRNQMEYVKVAQYEPWTGNETLPQYAEVPVPDDTYDIVVVAQPIDPETKAELPLESEPDVYDKGVQEITVSIHHVDRVVLETKNYKVDRLDVLSR